MRRSLRERIREHGIPLRIGSLSAALLGALIVSTAIMAWDYAANQRRISDATARFHALQVAADADRHFGQLRYWLTDLSVSLLTPSERNALQARERLDADLVALETFAPEAAQQIHAATNTYFDSAMRAVDAYTDDNRVIGNTHLAAARQSSDVVAKSLSGLVATLAEQADNANNIAAQDARRAQLRALTATILIVVLGALLTAGVLRSILRPLRRIDQAMAELNDGAEVVNLPPVGPDEFGRMARTLRTLHESQLARRRLEEAAAEQRRTVVTAVETIPDGFALYDAQDRLVLVNQRYRQMFASVADHLVEGTAFEQIVRAHVCSGSVDIGEMPLEDWIASRLKRHRDPAGLREEVPLGDGWMLVTKRKTPDGGTVAIYSDITDMKHRQAELETARAEAEGANDAKSLFLASMSHELRTPLNAIIGYSEMLIEDANDAGQTEPVADLERIMSSGKHLLALINDILDLSKIEAGKMEVHIETFEIAPLVEDVATTIAPLVQRNGNRMVVSIAPDVSMIETDKTKLRQNLFNLLSNATKFTKDGTVELKVTTDGTAIEFAVRDEGIGMTAEQQSRLFQAFMQADSSTTRNYGGTGLGLAIVKQFTEILGGGIEVSSEPGKGSTFTLTLPAKYQTGHTDVEDVPVGSKPSVLVIDDDLTALRDMANLVRAEGYRVLTAENAANGLALAREYRPDAILLDVIMPERDGWSVLRELKEDPDLCSTPVILATVVGDRDMGLAFGAVDHLIKPIDPKLLVERLNRIAGHDAREVLVVDDDPGTRALYRRVLVREGWAVREAADGEKALAQLLSKRPTLVVLDLMMPNLDGFDTLRKMRTIDALADLPVIIATSKDLSRRELEWLNANAREVVIKGEVGRAELIAAIRRHVGPAETQGEGLL
ncbi:MAG: response regulator [Albidovulum sp.]